MNCTALIIIGALAGIAIGIIIGAGGLLVIAFLSYRRNHNSSEKTKNEIVVY